MILKVIPVPNLSKFCYFSTFSSSTSPFSRQFQDLRHHVTHIGVTKNSLSTRFCLCHFYLPWWMSILMISELRLIMWDYYNFFSNTIKQYSEKTTKPTYWFLIIQKTFCYLFRVKIKFKWCPLLFFWEGGESQISDITALIYFMQK